MRKTCATALASLVLAGATAARADGDRGLRLAADAGFGAAGGAATSNLKVALDIREGAFALSLAARFRLRLAPGDGSVLRERDWDEPGDFLHILRRLAYARRLGAVAISATAGEIGGLTLGHGSLVRDYSNVADPDHPAAGLVLRLRHDRFSVTAFANDLSRPSLAGGRVAVRPIPAARAFVVGIAGAVDPDAPLALARQADGTLQVGGGHRPLGSGRPLGLLALDLGYELRFGAGHTVTPYVDAGTSFAGAGLHAGASARLRVGAAAITAQAEYRFAGPGYAPAYAGTFYDVERYQARLGGGGGAARPKLAAAEAGAFAGHGFLAEVGARLQDAAGLTVRAGGSLAPGPDPGALWLRATLRPLSRFDLGALLLLRGFGRDAAGDLRLGAAVVAEGRIRITRYLYGLVQFARRWALDPAAGGYRPFTFFNAAIGATWAG